jgi:Protein of unknown function (DUF3179)
MKSTVPAILILIITFHPIQKLIAQLKNPRNIEFTWKTDTANKQIGLNEISVVLPRNSFPTINYPKFIRQDDSLNGFYKFEPVIAVEINGKAKAYPLNMLTMHEISNDSLGGIPILPTFCPLCNSSVVYDRRLTFKDKEYLLDFEVSGMLRNSDMVMADKQTETWWQQLMGKGIVGELAGAELTVIPSFVISVEDFFNRYPDGKILSPKTGTDAENMYGINPYENYDGTSNKPWDRYFDPLKIDNRLAPMERIISLEGNTGYKVYPFSVLAEKKVINDQMGKQNIVLFYKAETVSVLDKKEISKSRNTGSATVFSSIVDGQLLVFKKNKSNFVDTNTNSIWDITGLCIKGKMKGKHLIPVPHGNHFAFAWLAFYPDSVIYSQ